MSYKEGLEACEMGKREGQAPAAKPGHLEPTWLKERTNTFKWSPDLHAVARVCVWLEVDVFEAGSLLDSLPQLQDYEHVPLHLAFHVSSGILSGSIHLA